MTKINQTTYTLWALFALLGPTSFAPADTPKDSPLLAEGPLSVTVEFKSVDGVHRYPAYLLHLRADRVCFRHKKGGILYFRPANTGKVVRIRSDDGNSVWSYDPTLRVFTGPRLPVPRVDLTPLSRKRDEGRILLAALERGFSRPLLLA